MREQTSLPLRFLLLLPLAIALAGCGGRSRDVGGGGGAPASTAAVLLSFKDGWTANDCGTMQIVWKFEPLNLTGSTGRDTPFDVSKVYNNARREPENHPSTGASGFRCYFDDGTAATDLRTGTWRITMNPTGGGPKCEELLDAGNVPIHFAEGQPGCVKGDAYPGR